MFKFFSVFIFYKKSYKKNIEFLRNFQEIVNTVAYF